MKLKKTYKSVYWSFHGSSILKPASNVFKFFNISKSAFGISNLPNEIITSSTHSIQNNLAIIDWIAIQCTFVSPHCDLTHFKYRYTMYCYNISLFLLVYSPSFKINSKIIQNKFTIGINDDQQHTKKKTQSYNKNIWMEHRQQHSNELHAHIRGEW